MRMARSRYDGSRYSSQVSAGSRTCPSASTTGALIWLVIVVASSSGVHGRLRRPARCRQDCARPKPRSRASAHGLLEDRRWRHAMIEHPRMSRAQRIQVSVVVLGDVGRSPRMLYHAQALASALAEVDVVGYAGSALDPAVRDHDHIRWHLLSPDDERTRHGS